MAQVILSSKKIKESLSRSLERLLAAIDRISQQQGLIRLEVPEPYRHLAAMGPLSRDSCHPLGDDCGDIAILMGVLKPIEGPKPKSKTRRRK